MHQEVEQPFPKVQPLWIGLWLVSGLALLIAIGLVFGGGGSDAPALLLHATAFLTTALLLLAFARLPLPGLRRLFWIIVPVVYAGLLVLVWISGLPVRPALLPAGMALTAVWAAAFATVCDRASPREYSLVRGGRIAELEELPQAEARYRWLDEPSGPVARDGIIIDLDRPLDPAWVQFLVDCKLHGKPVYHSADFYEAISGKVSLHHISGDVIESFPASNSVIYPFVKRLFDLAALAVLLPLALPVIALVTLIIKLRYPGPVIYWQDRVGRGGMPFKMAKFRSMYMDGEDGPKFADQEEPRITRLGRWIRKYRIDEIPQFWNVLKGNMSLIGPRPEQIPFAKVYAKQIPFYAYRHLVKPGITGWAQVMQGYTSGPRETREKIQFDLYYIKHVTPVMDLLILFKTIYVVLTGFGAK